MRAAVLRSVAVIGIGALLLAGLLYVASTVDRRAPTVAAISLTQPLPDEPAVALITTGLAVEFTEPVDMASAEGALRIEPPVSGSVSWSGSSMIFTPAERLELATAYAVTVTEGIVDPAGNRMTELPPPFSFETAGPPEVVETVPADGADGVAVDEPIGVTFSALMDTASVESALRLRPAFPHELRWSGTLLEIVPSRPLEAERDYEITIGARALDVSGVALASETTIGFRTVAPGLDAAVLVPADGSDGIAPTSPIAVIFDQPIDPESVTAGDALTITPEVAGSLELVDATGAQPASPNDATILRFQPSGPLPANTTFEVALGTGITSLTAGGLPQPISWSFTTGAPPATLSNQIAFLSDRGGIPNLWATNADGTAPRQVSTEMTPVLDYAVAPDGSSFVVGDGRRLVFATASGADRRVLTEDGTLEFDPTYAPDGAVIAFGRADVETGVGLGLWERPVDGGEATLIELAPDDASSSPSPEATQSDGDGAPAAWLRAPRYAPDGSALAFVDLSGAVGIVDLDTGEVVSVQYRALAPPAWLPDASRLLLTGRPLDRPLRDPAFGDRVGPLEPTGAVEVAVLDPSSSTLEASGFGPGSAVVAVAADGRIAHVGDDGTLRISDDPADAGSGIDVMDDERIVAASFGPGEAAVLVAVVPADGDDGPSGRLERIELDGSGRDVLVNDGWRPRWLP
jgi:hypothetical protein